MTVTGGRGRRVVAALLAGMVLLVAGRWSAAILADRWWATAVAPAAVPFLTWWHALRLGLECAGIAVAGAWCVGHALWVVRGIDSVQVPRRIGDLEIRELVGGAYLRPGAVAVGLLLGLLLGAGAGAAAPTVALAWHGAGPSAREPVLGLDAGIYLVHLPLWEAALSGARRLVWGALVLAAGAHLLVGGIRASRSGLAMTEAARQQTGMLTTLALLFAAVGEALGPLRSVAGLDDGPWSALAPSIRWGVAGAWAAAAVMLLLWTVRPAARRFVAAALLWAAPLLLGTVVAAATGGTTHGAVPAGAPFTGAPPVTESTLVAGERVREVAPGLWGRGVIPALVADHPGTRVLSATPLRLPLAGGSVPAWLIVRDDSGGRGLVVLADDRLGPGGAPVSFRDGDPAAYPGIVTWRSMPDLTVAPEAPDSIVAEGSGGIPLGGPVRRLVLAWGTQTVAALRGSGGRSALAWRRAPRDRIAHLFPSAWWDEPRAFLHDGRLWWVLDGWFLGAGAPLAPAIPWEEGRVLRYARRGLLAMIDAEGGETRLFRRPDADPVGQAWAELGGGLVLPPDSIPPALLLGSVSERALAVAARRVEAGAELPDPVLAWGPDGPVYEVPFGLPGAAGGGADRLAGLMVDAGDAGQAVIRWPVGSAPLTARALNARWGRFASLERLEDSIRAAGARLEAGEVRYDLGSGGTLAVRVRWAVAPSGAPTVAWVEVAEGERLGAARTPATALANLRGESAPVIPAPDLPDALHEARRWAAKADSALRAGDLQAFARAFEALKQILGTP